MPAQGPADQRTKLAKFPSAQRLREDIFRHIESITFLLYISTPDFVICKLSICNLKYLKCSSISKTLVNLFGKDHREIVLNENNNQTLSNLGMIFPNGNHKVFQKIAGVSINFLKYLLTLHLST